VSQIDEVTSSLLKRAHQRLRDGTSTAGTAVCANCGERVSITPRNHSLSGPYYTCGRCGNVAAVYLDRGGQIRLVADAKNTDCEDIADGRTPFEALAARVIFTVPMAGSKPRT